MQEYGYAKVTATDENVLTWEFHGATKNNAVLDRMTICKNGVDRIGSSNSDGDSDSNDDDVNYDIIIITTAITGAIIGLVVAYIIYTRSADKYSASRRSSRSSGSTSNHVEINAPLNEDADSSESPSV